MPLVSRASGVIAIAIAVAACGLDVVGAAPAPASSTSTPDGAALPSAADGGAGDGGAEDGGGADGAPPSDTAADAPVDAGTDAGSPEVIAVVRSASSASSSATLSSSTKAGDFLAVLVAQNKNSPASAVTNVTDDAPGGSDVFASAGQRSVNSACGIAAEIWYARNVKGGATHVNVSISSSNWYDLWVVELSGLGATGGADTGAVTSSQPASTVVSAPAATPSASPAVVLSVAQSCSTSGISGVHGGSPFTPVSFLEGNGAAYLVTSGAGSFGAVFDSADSAWNASTAAFR